MGKEEKIIVTNNIMYTPLTILENYKKQRTDIFISSMIEFEEMTEPKDKAEKRPKIILELHNESIDGTVALIEKEVERMRKKIVTKSEYERMDLSEMCEMRCKLNYNQALQDLLSSLKGNK
ncbi:hypothetical protein KAR91_72400 [Candidatus Pacearchaeota archaeon]|nr:hypothetical protein [Candidatus Pacearchaeota archaeon]